MAQFKKTIKHKFCIQYFLSKIAFLTFANLRSWRNFAISYVGLIKLSTIEKGLYPEYRTVGSDQCDQMLKEKVAQMFPKANQKLALQQFLPRSVVFHLSPKIHRTVWLLSEDNL